VMENGANCQRKRLQRVVLDPQTDMKELSAEGVVPGSPEYTEITSVFFKCSLGVHRLDPELFYMNESGFGIYSSYDTVSLNLEFSEYQSLIHPYVKSIIDLIATSQPRAALIAAYGPKGMGKSTVAEEATILGYDVIDSDDFGKEFELGKKIEALPKEGFLFLCSALFFTEYIPAWTEWIKKRVNLQKPTLLLTHTVQEANIMQASFFVVRLMPIMDPLPNVFARGRDLEYEYKFAQWVQANWQQSFVRYSLTIGELRYVLTQLFSSSDDKEVDSTLSPAIVPSSNAQMVRDFYSHMD